MYILDLTSVPFRLATVQMPILALIETKQITVCFEDHIVLNKYYNSLVPMWTKIKLEGYNS
jgi:hypothetical protein